MTKNKEPIYDEKVNYILTELKKGKSREEVAQELNYNSYKSLDMYLRRKNFKWDSNTEEYIPEQSYARVSTSNCSKVELVISMFTETGDSREVARKLNFSDHLELAKYMKTNGYVWNSEINNYVQEGEEKNINEGESEKENNKFEEPNKSYSSQNILLQLGKYLPLLELLEDNREELEKILDNTNNALEIKRYSIRGEPMNKTVYISRLLAKMLEEFSNANRTSQREIVEGALVEYFNKYGWHEVNSILNLK